MTDNGIKGRVHSFQSLGTVDGPGVRFVVFAQGCPLRCACCHNPDTWDMAGGKEYTPRQIVDRVLRYREYFGEEGGITVSGGEPLMQAEFVAEIFALCKAEGINTCLDTSGIRLDGQVRELLKLTDRVLLDVKYVSDEDYKAYVGCGIQPVLSFLEYLDKEGIPTIVRQVIIPSLNSSEDKVRELEKMMESGGKVAFVGDGINDAPVLARADVGIAMGGIGSDAATDAADVVIMDDDISKVADAIKLSRKCMRIAKQNIVFSIGVKLACLALVALGAAGMDLAIFADVGVLVIAVINSMRGLS